MRLTVFATALGSAVALVGFAGAANASATIDLIWIDSGTDFHEYMVESSAASLQVILTAGPRGVEAANVSVDYTEASSAFALLGFSSTPGGPLPFSLGEPIDTGSRIENISSASLPPSVGSGLAAGQSHQLGTVTLHKIATFDGDLLIQSDANGLFDGLSNLDGNDISATTAFNSAVLSNIVIDCFCDFAISINKLRGGSPTVTVNETKDITAKARIPKGTAPSDMTGNAMLRIDAIDGMKVIDSQFSGPIQLVVGKGGQGDTLTMNINQCDSGSIDFIATFTGPDACGRPCDASKKITKTCE
jgi:hypothetical protein